MAATGYANNVRTTNIGGWNFGFDVQIEWDSITRTNNTIGVNGMRSWVRVNSGSQGNTASGIALDGHYDLPDGTRRRNQQLATNWARGNSFATGKDWFDVGVGADATSVSSRAHVSVNGGSGSATFSLPIPSLGSPTGSSINASNRAVTTATLNASLTGWGANATAGDGQRIEYKKNADSPWVNLAFSTSLSHSRNLTGLIANTRYNARTWANNGGGKSANSSTIDFYTLPQASTIGTISVQATTAIVPTTQATGGGAYTITKQYRYRKGTDAWSNWTTFTGNNINLSGLLPSSEYEVVTRSTTTAGTTEGTSKKFTTLPAVELIYPDGTKKNAIPYLIYPDGARQQVEVKLIR